MKNFCPIGASTSLDHIWAYKVLAQKYINLGTFATLVLVYVQNFSPIRASISFDHIRTYKKKFGSKSIYFSKLPLLSLCAEFQPNWSKYKFWHRFWAQKHISSIFFGHSGHSGSFLEGHSGS